MPAAVNSITSSLEAYPMEELLKIKQALKEKNQKFYDFGVGDPKLPLWEPAIEALKKGAEDSLGYPSIRGIKELEESSCDYLRRRFSLEDDLGRAIVPTRGSKEAIFHIALSLIGREGKYTLAYPAPGYPVYKSSALFARGKPYPVELTEENNYLVEPWNFPKEVQEDLCALWVNYPHNPTGTTVSKAYWEKLVGWCQKQDVILLSDESYVDLYHVSLDEKEHASKRPLSPLVVSSDRVISFFSLSKRSGFTGLRAGFMAGDRNILEPHLKARANFGLSSPLCIQKAAAVTWGDDEHVLARRECLSERLDFAFKELSQLKLLTKKPEIPFYLWLKVPDKKGQDDVSFCLDLARDGFIATPGRWLGAKENCFFRLSLTLSLKEMSEAFQILRKHVI